MRLKNIFIIGGLMVSSLCMAGEELEQLDCLIKVTEENLDHQKALRLQVVSYLKLQDQYLQNPDDKDMLLRLAKEASKVLDSIKENHLTYSFPASFMSELTLFAGVANKRGVPSP